MNQAQNKSTRKEQTMGWVAMLIQKLGFSTEPREEIKDDDVTMAEADDGIGDHRPEMVNEQIWKMLPGFYWSTAVAKSRPGSEVTCWVRNNWPRG